MRRFTVLFSLVSLVVALAAVPASSQSIILNAVELDSDGGYVEGEVIVRFEPGTAAADRAAARSGIAATVRRNLLLSRTQLLTIPPGLTVQQAVERLERHPAVRYAEPNFITPLSAVPNDPDFAELWGLHNTGQNVNGTTGTADADIDAPEAWDITQGSANVLVGIIDSGIAYDHPDLAPNLWVNPGESGGGKETNLFDDDGNGLVDDWRGWDFLNDDNDPRDFDGHGSHVAGTIGARGNNAFGITGVSQEVSMVMAQACDSMGCPLAALVDAYMYVADLGARIANASLSGATFSQTEYDAIAANPGTLYVVAAGNDGANNDTTPHYPCAYNLANILCVAATDSNDTLAGFSNFGATSVDLAAPGVNVFSTFPSTTYEFQSGTSMATPHVAGAAALLQSVDPTITTAEMKTILMDTVDTLAGLSGRTATGGRLNAFQAVLATNAAPVASDDEYDATENTQLVVNAAAGLLDNDTDADPLIVSNSDPTSAEGGTVVVAADGSFTYDPPAEFNGVDTFGYTASDGALTDTAIVTITVAPPPPPPPPPPPTPPPPPPPPPPLPPLPPTETCPDILVDPGFTDLGGISDEAKHAVACLVAYDITEGTSATTFSPMLSVTRWQMALFLIRQASVHGVTLPAVEQHGFTDIGALPSATRDAINQLATLGITQGTSTTTFDPMVEVSRWQMALFLTRMANLVGITLAASPNSQFSDLDGLSLETQLAINQLATVGIVKGASTTTFDPMADVSRWQMALFLTRLLEADGVLLE